MGGDEERVHAHLALQFIQQLSFRESPESHRQMFEI